MKLTIHVAILWKYSQSQVSNLKIRLQTSGVLNFKGVLTFEVLSGSARTIRFSVVCFCSSCSTGCSCKLLPPLRSSVSVDSRYDIRLWKADIYNHSGHIQNLWSIFIPSAPINMLGLVIWFPMSHKKPLKRSGKMRPWCISPMTNCPFFLVGYLKTPIQSVMVKKWQETIILSRVVFSGAMGYCTCITCHTEASLKCVID